MKVLVTGGAGLIGSHLCESLISNGDEVICADNLKTGTLGNIQHCLKNPLFNLVGIDITTGVPNIDVDQIYNLASPTAPGHFKEHPIATIKSNIIGTINLLELAKKKNIPILHISSIRTLECNDTFNDNACYIESKRCSETICYEYRKFGVNVKVLRLFNIYGDGMSLSDSRVIPQFMLNAINGKDLIIYGDGTQLDSFCYVKDAVNLLKIVMNEDIVTPLTIGSKNFITIKSLAELIIDVTKSSSKLNFIKSNIKYPDRSNIIINNINNWKETTELRTGLEALCDKFKEMLYK